MSVSRTPLQRNWIGDAVLHEEPFFWVDLPRLFDRGSALTLAHTFPDAGFQLAGSGSSGYRFRYRPLVSKSHISKSAYDLAPLWQALARLLVTTEYVDSIAQLVGLQDVGGLRVDAGFCIYDSKCSLRPHTDRSHRILTQTIYFNTDWSPSWGGELRILCSNSLDDVVAEVFPQLNRSVVFRRSATSWHAVMPVRSAVVPRRSLLWHLTRDS